MLFPKSQVFSGRLASCHFHRADGSSDPSIRARLTLFRLKSVREMPVRDARSVVIGYQAGELELAPLVNFHNSPLPTTSNRCPRKRLDARAHTFARPKIVDLRR
jgi:hypothetical protein